MFTGIVEETGIVKRITPTVKSIRLSVACRLCARDTRIGDSIAVNGCCLTVVKASGRSATKLLEFDLLRETWNRTNFRESRIGGLVNLERSLRLQDRFGGHFVTGHIDGTGKIARWERVKSDWVLDVKAPPEVLRYILFKGSVAVDGISLTVASVMDDCFRIWIIPHTYEVTALRERGLDHSVNLEADLLGKYVEKFVTAQKPNSRPRSRSARVRG